MRSIAVELSSAIPAEESILPFDHVIGSAKRASFHFSHSPGISAYRTFPGADHVFIHELAYRVSRNSTSRSTHEDAEDSADAGKQQASDDGSGLGSGTGSDITASTGSDQSCRTSDRIGRICFLSAIRTVHNLTSP